MNKISGNNKSYNRFCFIVMVSIVVKISSLDLHFQFQSTKTTTLCQILLSLRPNSRLNQIVQFSGFEGDNRVTVIVGFLKHENPNQTPPKLQ